MGALGSSVVKCKVFAREFRCGAQRALIEFSSGERINEGRCLDTYDVARRETEEREKE